MINSEELLDCLPDGVLIHRDGRIVYANRAMARELGTSSLAELINTGLRQWVHPDEKRAVAALLAGAQDGPQEVRFVTRAGDTVALEIMVGGPLLFEGVEAMLLEAHDLTARKQLEAEVLRISNRERQRIAHDLHDGLGQQLTAIGFKARALVDTLRDSGFDPADAEELVRLLADATAHSRDLAHGLDPAVERQSLAPLLEKLANQSSRLYRIACRFEDQSGVRVDAPLVARNLYLVVQEAVNNAVRHGKATEVDILLGLIQETLTVTVRDNGRGFTQQGASASGMGLRIMQHRAHTIGGTIEWSLCQSGGTVARCRVPFRQ